MSVLTRAERWRKAKRVRLVYTLITFIISIGGIVLCDLLNFHVGTVLSLLLAPPSIVWGIFSFKVSEYKPIYLERKYQ